ncbi:testis-specific Y-encoded protein 3-like, partial [Fukomys damarensis]|uniref:testis-specific Y-encoded protein 3-like n=1 Tax=Fukomys damarensis TaxID=885580 RepID=UPI000540085B
VKEEARPSNCSKISLFFRSNPYFHNALLVKEFVRHTTGYRASRSTPIQWCAAYKHRADSRSQQNRSANFFNWFTDHTLANCERITQIILEDLWLCPLSYYYSDFKKTPEEGAEHTGEQVSRRQLERSASTKETPSLRYVSLPPPLSLSLCLCLSPPPLSCSVSVILWVPLLSPPLIFPPSPRSTSVYSPFGFLSVFR